MIEINKDLIAASLAPMLLMILERGESYGYDLIQQLKQRSNGELNIAEGTLYPVLKKMEEKEWIKAVWKTADNGRDRRYYSITRKGKEQLKEQVSQWNFVNQLIHQLCLPKTFNLSML
jgi:PadR family transcriptional regulator, regulatory protein PadR